MKERDVSIAAVVATIMQVSVDDPRLPIVIDVVRSMDALHRSQDKARAGRLGVAAKAKQTASKLAAERQQKPSRTPADSVLLEPASIENYEGNTAAQAVALSCEGGFGGLSRSGSVPPSVPVPPDLQKPIPSDRERDERPPAQQARLKLLAEPEYPMEFERLWTGCDRQGNKAEALKAWMQAGQPAADVLVASWADWKRVRWYDGIGVPHVSTWLRKFGWKEKPAPRLGATGPLLSDRESGNRSALEAFVRNGEAKR